MTHDEAKALIDGAEFAIKEAVERRYSHAEISRNVLRALLTLARRGLAADKQAETLRLIQDIAKEPDAVDRHAAIHSLAFVALRDYSADTGGDAVLAAPGPDEPSAWLPIVLCPTDGVDRLLRLPDGSEVVGNFDSRQIGRKGWQIRSIAYHNPSRIIGQRGGVDQWSQAYDTYLISDLPEGVHPTHFRPNDTVCGAAEATPPEESDDPISEKPTTTEAPQ